MCFVHKIRLAPVNQILYTHVKHSIWMIPHYVDSNWENAAPCAPHLIDFFPMKLFTYLPMHSYSTQTNHNWRRAYIVHMGSYFSMKMWLFPWLPKSKRLPLLKYVEERLIRLENQNSITLIWNLPVPPDEPWTGRNFRTGPQTPY